MIIGGGGLWISTQGSRDGRRLYLVTEDWWDVPSCAG